MPLKESKKKAESSLSGILIFLESLKARNNIFKVPINSGTGINFVSRFAVAHHRQEKKIFFNTRLNWGKWLSQPNFS